MQLKIYQENVIDELLTKAKQLLGYSGEKKIIFKAPTGSGKTIMMAEFLKRLVDDREIKTDFSFIWTAPRPILTNQSKKKLEDYFEKNKVLECSFFEDLDDRKIEENEILFFNWEKVRREELIYIRDNEQENNLPNVIKRTKEDGREIIMIIDESHYQAQSDAAKKWIKEVAPKLVIEVSATPRAIEQPDDNVNVHIEDVKAEGMIKKAVVLNEKFVNLLKKGKIESDLSGSSEALVIDAALKKRKELLEAFQKEKADINPLVLIQLPDQFGKSANLINTMKDRVIRILEDKYKISKENGKLAIWLSGEHVNKEDVEKNDSKVEVLIFKQAIALGWDCPRAQILVLFRQWHSPIFSIQTIGRIMRMPEPEEGHYTKEILNYGYVYTNLSDIEIKEDIAGYVAVYLSKRRSDYKPINLLSCYSERHREKTRLSPLFIEIFLKEARSYGLKKKIDRKRKKLDIKIFNDWKKEDVDALVGKKFVGDKAIKVSGLDLQRLFDFFIRDSLQQGFTSFYPQDRSVDRLKESIYKFFEIEFKFKRGEQEDEIVQVALDEKNKQHFVNTIDRVKEKYQKEVTKREPELGFKDNWNIPESLTFGEDCIKEGRKKSIMQPFYARYGSDLEKSFVDFLEKSRNIEWWFKNGDRDATFFALPYENGEPKPFYVDFIVKMKDGRIGLFDPHGSHLSDFGPKSDGLQKYIKEENKKGKKFFGGIVANTDSRNYRGRWVYFDKPSKEFKDNFDNWVDLEL